MDVLIMERDDLVGSVLADTLAVAGISAAVLADEEALRLPPDQPPKLVITGLNRTNYEDDLTGLMLVSALRRKWPRMRAIYLAALWPACLSRQELTARERFLRKPIGVQTIIDTVRELLRPLAASARETRGQERGCDVTRLQSDKPAPKEPPEAPEALLPDPLDDEPAPQSVPPRAPPDPIVAALDAPSREHMFGSWRSVGWSASTILGSSLRSKRETTSTK
jgi:hypothetical protein